MIFKHRPKSFPELSYQCLPGRKPQYSSVAGKCPKPPSGSGVACMQGQRSAEFLLPGRKSCVADYPFYLTDNLNYPRRRVGVAPL